MRFRALFVGGPVDGQERVLARERARIDVADRAPTPVIPGRTVTYRLLFAFGTPTTLVYSLWDRATTLVHVWNRYVRDDHA
jgi:hypothetical protein